MAKWQVYKLVKENGNVPYDKWFERLTIQDQARVDQAISAIEGFSEFPAEKVKKYRDLHELKIYGNKTALRPLAIKDTDGKIIILLVGVTKKGKILPNQYDAARNLANEYRKGGCSVKGYWED